ncbi:MAG TPA: hypothetical protein VFU36_18005, partial [Jatrophihabitans sp.]|nr:hypothetical protein [Jatrophihabitans sp.]
QLWTALRTLYPISLSIEEAVKTAGGEVNDLSRDFLVEEIVADAQAAYDQREEELGSENTRELERRVLLSVLDRKWREHLYEMDYLQEGIGLRAMAQRDPLVEYQREGYDMFAAMMEAIQEESVGFLFNLEVEIEPAPDSAGLEGVAPNGAAPGVQPGGGLLGAGPDGAVPHVTGPDGADLDAEAVLASIASGESEPKPAGAHPHISAKGLDRNDQKAPLTYSAPALGSEAPEVHTEGGQRSATSRAAKSAGQRRANPNRGSRGNKRKR